MMTLRDKRVLKLANRFLEILRTHKNRYEAIDAMRIADRLFVHPVVEKNDD